MSHDLYLYPDPSAQVDFKSAFAMWPSFKVGDIQAEYENKDTGCHFFINRTDGIKDADDDRMRRPHFHVNLNYFRPSTFGLEVAPIVEKLVSTWRCTIDDPQIHGHGSMSAFDRDAYLRGWNAGNAFAVEAITSNPGWAAHTNGIFTSPRAIIHDVWAWNDRLSNRRAIEIEYYLPTIMWGKTASSELLRLVVWGDNLHQVLPPQATHVLVVVGNKLQSAAGLDKSMRLLTVEAVKALASTQNSRNLRGQETTLIGNLTGAIPSDLIALVRKAEVVDKATGFGIVPAAQVIDAELFEPR
jgi:hypothetical protein